MKVIRVYAECYDEETDGTYLVQLEPSEAIAVAREMVRPEGWEITVVPVVEEGQPIPPERCQYTVDMFEGGSQ